MGSWVDRLGMIVVDAGISAAAMLAVLSLGLVACREPSWRLRLVRGAFLGLLALIPLKLTGELPRLDLWSLPEQAGLSHPALTVDGPGQGWLRGILLVHALGVTLSLGWLLLGYLGLSRLAARGIDPSAEAMALYGSLVDRAKRRLPSLRISPVLRGPILVGLVRQTILIPSTYDPPEPSPASLDRLRLCLLHELAHHEGRDPLYLLAGRLAQCFWFFLPPLGWVLDRMRLDQEFEADRQAALGSGEVGSYAASLLDLSAARRSDFPANPSPDGTIPTPDEALDSPLIQRFWMLLKAPARADQRPHSWWSWVLPSLTALVTLGTSSLALMPASAARAPGLDRPIQGARAFLLSRLEVAAGKAEANGRAPRVELPIRLPPTFDLVVDVLSTPATLARTRVAGRPVGSAALAPLVSPRDEAPASWRVVRLRRQPKGDTLWIDGQKVPLPADADPFPVWLTFEPPPDIDAQYRNLCLRW